MDTVSLIGESVGLCLLRVLFSLIMLILEVSRFIYYKRRDRKESYSCSARIFVTKLLIYSCIPHLYLSLFNIILYYMWSTGSNQINELEIYWPFALIVGIIIILHVCEATMKKSNFFADQLKL